MARYVMRVRTPKDAEQVFDFLADLRNFPEWDPGTTSAEQVGGTGPGVGSAYDLETGGTTMRYEVTTYDHPRKVVAEGANRWVTSVDTITVSTQDDGAGAVVTYDADLTLNGLLRVGDPILKLAFARIGKKAADGLVTSLDGTRID